MDVTLYGKRNFDDVIKLRIVRWRDYPRLSEGTLNITTCVLIEGGRGKFDYR